MTLGTKSVLFGAHSLWLHPWFVALAWWDLYGFPFDPRLWVAFFVHDLGYIGKPNLDGDEGERHPEFGANVMAAIFGERWGRFTLLHSRFYAKRIGEVPSRLCYADKLSFVKTPRWLYLLLANATGEIHEYMERNAVTTGKYAGEGITVQSQREWHASVTAYLTRFTHTKQVHS